MEQIDEIISKMDLPQAQKQSEIDSAPKTSQNQSTTTQDQLKSAISGLPLRFKESGFKNFIEKNPSQANAKLLCKQFFEYKTAKQGLFFCGPVGTGKTHMAVATLRNLRPVPFIPKIPVSANPEQVFYRRATARIFNADEFFMVLNDAIAERKSKLKIIQELLTDNDVLCLDDLGTKNFTEAKQENLYALINTAYLNLRKIVITTNFTLDDLAKFDERIASRLSEMCHIIMLGGEDYRVRN